MNRQQLSRRQFIKLTGYTGTGLVLGASLSGCSDAPLAINGGPGVFTPDSFIQITADNVVNFFCPRQEIGQGITTGLATLVAEELDVVPGEIQIHLVGAHPDYANPDFGVQATGGSTSMNVHYLPLRQLGANARSMILQAASEALGVSVGQMATDNAHVLAGGQSYPYSQFAEAANKVQLDNDAPLKEKALFKHIGSNFPRLDAVGKATGTTQYGIDVQIPNMHYAVVSRPPVIGSTVLSVDASKTSTMPGVTDVVEIASGVAVVAEKYWQARKAVKELVVEWRIPERLGSTSTENIKSDYRNALDTGEGVRADDAEVGDVQTALANASTVLEQDYWTPFLAHAPMEPMNAVVHVHGESAEVWTGSQGPEGVEGLVARHAGVSKDKVTVHSQYSGGGFGRRGALTHIVEATQTAVAANKPVKLIWSREDDVQGGLYRPASMMRIKAGISANGNLTAWDARRAGANITPYTLSLMMPGLLPSGVPELVIDWAVNLSHKAMSDWTVDAGSIEGLFGEYDAANSAVTHITQEHGMPVLFWRSVGHSYTAFAVESMMDELAHAAGLDPVQFRIDNLKGNPRLQNVLRVMAAEVSSVELTEGRVLGFAAHKSFGSYVAQAAEVSVNNGQIRVHNVHCVVDCGTVVNPDIVRAQVEGSVMYGLTAALYGNLDLDKGQVLQSNFHDYPILRMDEAPAVSVTLIDSDQLPTGMGEPALPPIAPAVANAVFKATGQRLRSLPLQLV